MNTREPLQVLRNQGLILGPDNQKMSKSKGNVISPDEVNQEYGVDCLRAYEMFMGPYEDSAPWSTEGIKGVARFLDKVWQSIERLSASQDLQVHNPELSVDLNLLIAQIDQKIPALQFNTCISDFMKFFNQHEPKMQPADLKVVLKLMFPFTPVIAAEGLERLGEPEFLEKYYNPQEEVWPLVNQDSLQQIKKQLKVQIKNKFRGNLPVTGEEAESEIIQKIRENSDLANFLPQKITRIIYVPGKIINIL